MLRFLVCQTSISVSASEARLATFEVQGLQEWRMGVGVFFGGLLRFGFYFKGKQETV